MIEHDKPNPFVVLGLPTDASEAEIAERAQELSDLAPTDEARRLHRWAREQVITRPRTRLAMSSSADALGWNAFSERPVGAAGALASPASEMAAVLQRYRSDLDAAQAEVEAACRRGLEALAQQAVLAVRLEAALALYEPQLAGASMEKAHQHLRILKDQMLAELAAAGVEPVRLE